MTSKDTETASAIAIVGMSLRVPGASNPEQYWSNLLQGIEMVRPRSDDELIAAGEHPDRLRDPRYVKAAAVLEGLDQFDPEFFGLSPKEGGIMDPQHRQLLECAWEALEDAGHPPQSFDGPIGVWAGCGMGSYFMHNVLSNRELVDSTGLFLLRHTGNDKDFLATRISYALNLHGPSIGVQTACSTSLVAVHYACQSLLSSECDMALAGGVTLELPHGRGYVYEEGEILSPDGHCRAFDHRSAGTVFGSGAGMVVLRRLDDALAAGDRIYGVIRGTAVNNDGSGKVGYLAPSVEGQAAAVAEALAVADVPADTVGYVECHGTGTAVGDPIEIAALTTAFRETSDKRGYCAIGSVKTNIGHLDTAAGVASLIKATLCVQRGQLPPSLNFEKPNPLIDFGATPFFVNNKLRDFPAPKGHRRRACVNSLGVGGTNAHAVVEAPPERPEPARTARPAELLVLSGRKRGVLDAGSKRLAEHLRQHADTITLADVAYTLQVGRTHFGERRVLACRDVKHAAEMLEQCDPRKVFTHSAVDGASVVFMFPGGGAQYPDMGRALYEQEPVFKEHVDRGLALLSKLIDRDPRELLFPQPEARAQAATLLERPSLQLPLIYIIEYALAQLWFAWGVKPAALIGHSVGENTAAAVAGVLSFEDGLKLVSRRGQLFDEVEAGGMLSVPLSAQELSHYLGDDLDLACVNAPELSVASGPTALLAQLKETLAEHDIEAQPIRINVAAHSRMLGPILDRFAECLRSLRLSAPRIPIISNRTGETLSAEDACSPEYWVSHLRNTVHFGDGIGKLLEQPGRVFLEVGPGRALSSLARLHPDITPGQAFIGSLPHPDDDTPANETFLAAYGRLWAAGVDLPLARTRGDGFVKRIGLPTYAFDHQRYWIEPQAPRATSEPSAYPSRIQKIERMFFAPVWRAHHPDLEPDVTPHTWLVFVDKTGLGEALVESLRTLGSEVICVREGDTFVKSSDTEYRLAPEQGAEAYEQLLREVLASGKTPERVAHLWLLADREVFRPGSTFFHRNQECGFYSLLFLSQALAAVEWSSNLHIAVVSRGMQHAGSTGGLHPDQATLLGPVKVIPRELPGITCLSIDLEGKPQGSDAPVVSKLLESAERYLPGIEAFATPKLEQLRAAAQRMLPEAPAQSELVAPVSDAASELEALLTELRLPPSNGEVVLSAGTRWQRRYERLRIPPTAQPRLRQRGVYLITGGLGGIGLSLARTLAEQEHARLVLVSRTPLPEPSGWAGWLASHPSDPVSSAIRHVQQLEALGAEVMVCAGDVADLDRMREVVAEAKARFGALHGVIHAAGVLDDAPIAAKRQRSVENVFGPKVYGTLVLDRVLQDEPLDFLVLFSSTSTAIAAAGQVDYVAANAFLDAYAEQARAKGRKVLSLAWGVWKDVGLAASAGARLGGGSAADGPTSYPLFHSKANLPSGAVLLRGTFEGAAHWIVDEHRTANKRAVLPGTGYLELARAALREVGHEGPFAIEDLVFLRPMEVQEDSPLDFRVRLTPTDDGFSFELQSKLRLATGQEGYVLHASALLRRFARARSATLDVTSLRARCQARVMPETDDGYRVAQEKHLRFGPRWQNLRSYAFGEREAFGMLRLRDRFRDDVRDFGLHPGLLDIATGFAIELASGYGKGERLWVPVSYGRVLVYADLTPELLSHIRLAAPQSTGHAEADAGFARFDISLADDEGNVLVEITGFSMQAIAGTSFESSQPRPQELEQDGPKRELSGAERAFMHNLSQGLTPAEGAAAFRRAVDTLPRACVMVSSMHVRELQRQTDAMVPEREHASSATFQRPALSSEYLAPRNDIERTLAGMWENLLGVEQVGVQDNFFELGGHSLIAVRLFARMKKTFGVDFPISTLIEHPTIEACARLVPASGPARPSPSIVISRRFKHLVPMNPPDAEQRGKLPFFLVAGMFGNVMNLRHLAQLIGQDRPFHGIQARGLLGKEEPHETFEEMARDYLEEMRAVQPHGPYLIGGFSGGGLAAYEIARQLVEAGESVPLLVMLDTPLPSDKPLTRHEKLLIHKQNFERQGARFVLNWIEKKVAYREELRERANSRETQAANTNAANFRSQLIEAAFYRALERYTIAPLPVPILLCRPRLRPTHVFGPGNAINKDRRRIYHDNGWNRYSSSVAVFETPGDHDSMVLEPNVRILATHLRPVLDEAERSSRVSPSMQALDMSLGDVPGLIPANQVLRDAAGDKS